MRPTGTRNPDHVAKAAILQQLRAAGHEPQFAIEDRPRVQRMYRNAGLRVLDPATWCPGLRDNGHLVIAIAPAGAPIRKLLDDFGWLRENARCSPDCLVSAAAIRANLLRGTRQSHPHQPHPEENDIVAEICRTRVLCGLPALALTRFPSARRRRKLRATMPGSTPVTYLVSDRPAEDKMPVPRDAAAARRILREHRSLRGQLRTILGGDGLPTRILVDPGCPPDIHAATSRGAPAQPRMTETPAETYLAARHQHIAVLWGRRSITRIARDLGLSRQRVSQIGKSLGLHPLSSSPNALLPDLPANHAPPVPERPETLPLPTGLPASGKRATRTKRKKRPQRPPVPRTSTAEPKTTEPPAHEPVARQPCAHPRESAGPKPPGQYSSLPPPDDPLTQSIRESLRKALRLRLTLPTDMPRAPSLRLAYGDQGGHNLLNRLSAAYALRNRKSWRNTLLHPDTPSITDTVRWSLRTSPQTELYVPFAALFLLAGEPRRNSPMLRLLPIQISLALDANRPATLELQCVLALHRCFHDPSFRACAAVRSLQQCGTARAHSLAPLIHAACRCDHDETLAAAAAHHAHLAGRLRRLAHKEAAPSPRAFLDLSAAAALHTAFHAPHSKPSDSCLQRIRTGECSPFFHLTWLQDASNDAFLPPASRIVDAP